MGASSSLADGIISYGKDFVAEHLSKSFIGQFLQAQQAPSDCRLARHEADSSSRVNKFFECEFAKSSKANFDTLAIVVLVLSVVIIAGFFLCRWACTTMVNRQISSHFSQTSHNQTNIQLVGGREKKVQMDRLKDVGINIEDWD